MIVPAGAPTGRARPVQPLGDPTALVSRSTSFGRASDEEHAPALDLLTDPGDLRRQEHTAPVEAAPVVTHSLLRSWDDAINAYVAEGDEPAWLADAVAQSPAVAADPSASTLESMLLGVRPVECIWNAA